MAEMKRGGERMERGKGTFILLVALLAFAALLLTGCGQDSVFDGSATANADGFWMDYSVLNREQTADLALTAGDQLRVTLSHARGTVDVTVGMDGQTPVYRGTGQANAEFTLMIEVSGTYRISVTGHQAKGQVSFLRVSSAAD